jgi:hypothetical protein
MSSTLNVMNDATFINKITVQNITLGTGNGDISANVGVGYQALMSNTTGYSNTANGCQALMSNTTGYNNTANGYQALMSNTTGYSNLAVGYQVLISNTTGHSNVGVGGYRTLQFNTTGDHNIGIGLNTLRDGTTGNYNIGIGYGAGYNLYAGSDNNILLGYNTKFSSSTTVYNNSTAIGYNAQITASDQITLGHTDTNVHVPYRMGIGTTAPEGSLHISSSQDAFLIITGDNNNNNETVHPHLIFQQDGNYNEAGIFLDDSNDLVISASTSGGGDIHFKTDTGASNTNIDNLTDAPTRMTITPAGFVGIGTTSPRTYLEINGIESVAGDYEKYSNENSTRVAPSSTTKDVSLHVNSGIGCSVIYYHSDRRMKTDIVDVPDNLALQQVRDIPCRYYEYIDKVSKGSKKVVGFIAQEVDEVLPTAITKMAKYIPDEYRSLENISWEEIGDISSNITYKLSSDLTDVSGINYRFIVTNDVSNDTPVQKDIVGNSDNTFTFDASYQYVFCYGKEVDDFHIIDKNQIFALHHSAIQEIDRLQLEEKEKTTALETKVTELETKNTPQLNHNFVEGPRMDNIYRGHIQLANGAVEINLDTQFNMTEGTFVGANQDISVFTTNEDSWDNVRGKVTGNILKIECQNTESTALISYLVIGERHTTSVV